MKIERESRILIFAPHPDDEALATAGVLQRAVAAGATVRVVFATNGDNNPWPHRVLERRWKIKPVHRMRWAARRAEEALASLATLGIPSGCVEFLGLPDQQITDLFLRARMEVLPRLTAIIKQTRPSLVFAPAPFDLHPDHSALHLFVRNALMYTGANDAEQLYYMVHTRGYHSDWNRTGIHLTPAEQAAKRQAILCHRTQIALSRQRFLRHAKPVEEFWERVPAREIDMHHPVRGGHLGQDALVLQLQRRKRNFAACTLLLAPDNEATAWSMRLRRTSGAVKIAEAGTGRAIGLAELEVRGIHAQLTVPLKLRLQPVRLYVKLKEPSVFFDSGGWREIPDSVVPVAASNKTVETVVFAPT